MLRSIVVVVSLAAAAAGAQPHSQGPFAERAALLALRDARSADLSQLLPLAASRDPVVRAGVATHLGSVPFAGGAAVVGQLLRDPDPSVRTAAAMAAGRLLRDLPAGEARRGGLTTALGEALRHDREARVRAAAAWGLAAGGGNRAERELLRALGREKSEVVRTAALGELWRLGGSSWVRAAAAAVESRRPTEERLAATWSLARAAVGDPAAALALRRAAADGEAAVRAVALSAARRGSPVDLWEALTAGAMDADPRVRQAAWDGLAAVLEREGRGRVLPEPVLRRVQELVRSREAELAHERVLAIRLAGLSGCCAAELARLAAGSDPWPAEEALVALARLGVEEPVWGVLEAPENWRRRAGVRAVRWLPGGLAKLVAAAADGDVAVRLAAVEELARAGGEEAVAALKGRLEDEDGAVRAAALEGLEALRVTLPKEQLLPLLRREATAPLPDAAVALVRALKAALPDPDVRSQLEELVEGGGSPVLARAAWEALGRRGPPPSLPASASPEFYHQVAAWAAEPRWLSLVTVRGTLVIELNTVDAPLASFRISALVDAKFYDGLTFHRVVPNFVVQGGDPRGDGWGGPEWTLRDELSVRPFVPGTVGLALSGPDTAGSQLFVTLTRQPHLDGRYPVLGQLVAGLEVAARLRRGDRILRARTGSGAPPPTWPVWYGELSLARLDAELAGWREERERYTPAPDALARLASATLRYGLDVAMGTWCSDSHEQIPRLQRILAELGERSPFTTLRLRGVDRSKELDWPFGPVELVPTIVVTLEGGEVGRIVETPASGRLEEDLVRLLAPLEGWPE